MKRLLVVLSLWGCPSDPATTADPEVDQGVVDAAVDAGGAAPSLALSRAGPCDDLLPVASTDEVIRGDQLTATVTVVGTDPGAGGGRMRDGTEVILLTGGAGDAPPVLATVEAGALRLVAGRAGVEVYCLGAGRADLEASIAEYRSENGFVGPVGSVRSVAIECVDATTYARRCGGDRDALVDRGVIDGSFVDAAGDGGPHDVPDAQRPDGALPDAELADVRPADAAAPDASLPDLGVVVDVPPPPLRCAAVRPLGGACYGDDRACEPGLTCISGRCATRSAERGDCDGSSDCEGQLYCRAYSLNGEQLAVGICSVRGPVGAACHRRNFGCEFELTCLSDTCVPYSMLGGPCLTTGDCDRTTWCDRPGGIPDGICQPLMPEGTVCDPFNSGCGPNLACLEGLCGMRQPMGEGCQSAADCQPNQYCDRLEEDGRPRLEAICLDRVPLGADCNGREAQVCQQSRCIQGACATDQPLGAPCDSTFDCLAGGFCPQP